MNLDTEWNAQSVIELHGLGYPEIAEVALSSQLSVEKEHDTSHSPASDCFRIGVRYAYLDGGGPK